MTDTPYIEKIRRYNVADLLRLMARLRDPKTGCPWDLKQSYRSITGSTIEEAYEVVDAIEQGDLDHLQEELGDLLFQVIFYSQLATEDARFSFLDVVDQLTAKLIRRHPHVFPDGTLESVNQYSGRDEKRIKENWESLKQEERAAKGKSGVLHDVPVALPALSRAEKLQKRAARVGFDWRGPDQVVAKVKEEVEELERALQEGNVEQQAEELGDLLFSAVNLARHLKLDPEAILRSSNNKFVRRFEFIENGFSDRALSMTQADQTLMEALWQEAKQRGL